MKDDFTMPFWGPQSSDELAEYLTSQADPMLNIGMIQNYVLKSDNKTSEKPIKFNKGVKKKYIPGKSFYNRHKTSTLTRYQHGICLKVLKRYKAGRSENSFSVKEQEELAIYKKLVNQMKVENVQFLECAKSYWPQCKKERLNEIEPWVRDYSDKLWKTNLQRSLLYPQFYTSVNKSIQLSYEITEPSIVVQHFQDILHLGKIAKFVKPMIFVKRPLKAESAPIPNEMFTYNSQLPVSLDNNINPMLENHDFDVVISSSALKRLMDDTDYDTAWDIPVVVKEIIIKGTQKMTKVVYLDKPLPNRSPTIASFNYRCYKRLIKTNYCMFPGLTFPTDELLRLFPKPVDLKMCNTDNIKGKLDENSEYNNGIKPDCEDEVIINNKILHNVSYRIWNISIADEQNTLMKTKVCGKNIKILVRTKTDAVETTKETNGVTPLVIVPKLEYQIEYGANISTKSELIRQWTALFFRPRSDMYRVRLTSGNSEVVSIERVNCQQINYETHNSYNYKPVLRLGVLYKVFSKLIELQAGNYLLSHTNKQGPFVEILKSTELNPSIKKKQEQILDLHLAYSAKTCKLSEEINVPWCPLDVHYVLPQHEAFERMPGLFGKFNFVNAKKKKSKKAKKMISKKCESVPKRNVMVRIDFDKPANEDD